MNYNKALDAFDTMASGLESAKDRKMFDEFREQFFGIKLDDEFYSKVDEFFQNIITNGIENFDFETEREKLLNELNLLDSNGELKQTMFEKFADVSKHYSESKKDVMKAILFTNLCLNDENGFKSGFNSWKTDGSFITEDILNSFKNYLSEKDSSKIDNFEEERKNILVKMNLMDDSSLRGLSNSEKQKVSDSLGEIDSELFFSLYNNDEKTYRKYLGILKGDLVESYISQREFSGDFSLERKKLLEQLSIDEAGKEYVLSDAEMQRIFDSFDDKTVQMFLALYDNDERLYKVASVNDPLINIKFFDNLDEYFSNMNRASIEQHGFEQERIDVLKKLNLMDENNNIVNLSPDRYGIISDYYSDNAQHRLMRSLFVDFYLNDKESFEKHFDEIHPRLKLNELYSYYDSTVSYFSAFDKYLYSRSFSDIKDLASEKALLLKAMGIQDDKNLPELHFVSEAKNEIGNLIVSCKANILEALNTNNEKLFYENFIKLRFIESECDFVLLNNDSEKNFLEEKLERTLKVSKDKDYCLYNGFYDKYGVNNVEISDAVGIAHLNKQKVLTLGGSNSRRAFYQNRAAKTDESILKQGASDDSNANLIDEMPQPRAESDDPFLVDVDEANNIAKQMIKSTLINQLRICKDTIEAYKSLENTPKEYIDDAIDSAVDAFEKAKQEYSKFGDTADLNDILKQYESILPEQLISSIGIQEQPAQQPGEAQQPDVAQVQPQVPPVQPGAAQQSGEAQQPAAPVQPQVPPVQPGVAQQPAPASQPAAPVQPQVPPVQPVAAQQPAPASQPAAPVQPQVPPVQPGVAQQPAPASQPAAPLQPQVPPVQPGTAPQPAAPVQPGAAPQPVDTSINSGIINNDFIYDFAKFYDDNMFFYKDSKKFLKKDFASLRKEMLSALGISESQLSSNGILAITASDYEELNNFINTDDKNTDDKAFRTRFCDLIIAFSLNDEKEFYDCLYEVEMHKFNESIFESPALLIDNLLTISDLSKKIFPDSDMKASVDPAKKIFINKGSVFKRSDFYPDIKMIKNSYDKKSISSSNLKFIAEYEKYLSGLKFSVSIDDFRKEFMARFKLKEKNIDQKSFDSFISLIEDHYNSHDSFAIKGFVDAKKNLFKALFDNDRSSIYSNLFKIKYYQLRYYPQSISRINSDSEDFKNIFEKMYSEKLYNESSTDPLMKFFVQEEGKRSDIIKNKKFLKRPFIVRPLNDLLVPPSLFVQPVSVVREDSFDKDAFGKSFDKIKKKPHKIVEVLKKIRRIIPSSSKASKDKRIRSLLADKKRIIDLSGEVEHADAPSRQKLIDELKKMKIKYGVEWAEYIFKNEKIKENDQLYSFLSTESQTVLNDEFINNFKMNLNQFIKSNSVSDDNIDSFIKQYESLKGNFCLCDSFRLEATLPADDGRVLSEILHGNYVSAKEFIKKICSDRLKFVSNKTNKLELDYIDKDFVDKFRNSLIIIRNLKFTGDFKEVKAYLLRSLDLIDNDGKIRGLSPEEEMTINYTGLTKLERCMFDSIYGDMISEDNFYEALSRLESFESAKALSKKYSVNEAEDSLGNGGRSK